MGKEKGGELSLAGFGLRLLFAAALVFLTYNPSGYSFYHWLRRSIEADSLGPLHLLAAVVLLIGWTIFVRATTRSLGAIGLILGSAFLGALVWVLIDFGLLAANSMTAISWIVEASLAVLLAIGMSWSYIRRRLSGQLDTDELD